MAVAHGCASHSKQKKSPKRVKYKNLNAARGAGQSDVLHKPGGFVDPFESEGIGEMP